MLKMAAKESAEAAEATPDEDDEGPAMTKASEITNSNTEWIKRVFHLL